MQIAYSQLAAGILFLLIVAALIAYRNSIGRLPGFTMWLLSYALPYSFCAMCKVSWLRGWGLAAFVLSSFVVAFEASDWNCNMHIAYPVAILCGLALLGFSLSASGTLAVLPDTSIKLLRYRIVGVVAILAGVGSLFPAVYALFNKEARLGGLHGALLSCWFLISVVALGAWNAAPVPALEVGGTWVVNPEYKIAMDKIYAYEALAHAGVIAVWSHSVGVKL